MRGSLLMLVLAGVWVGGCSQSPTEAYIDMTTCAQMGDRGCFLDGFTSESRALVESAIGLSEAYGMRESNPHRLLVFDEVVDESFEGEGDKQRAVLNVRSGGRKSKIVLVQEDGAWRIDTEVLDAWWKDNGRR